MSDLTKERVDAAWLAREDAWRKRYPEVARSPLYDHGWADALLLQVTPRTVTAEYAYCPIHGDLLAGSRSMRCAEAAPGHEYP